jgi:hypothetical protein
MATILLQAAGTALGGVFGPVGAVLGRAAGALAGSVVDRALIGGSSTVTGARLSMARYPGADDGTAVSRVYGAARVGGTLIWATRFEEETIVERSGSKGSGAKTRSFQYFANLALGLCEGPIACVRRVWADGREIDLAGITLRVYPGNEAQMPDPLIEAKQGSGKAPAYRGLAYVVFERLPLDGFGNRIPLLQFEVVRPVGQLERQIRAVTIIPGSTEYGYAGETVTEKTGDGSARILNRNTLVASSDWEASLNELTAVCPNLQSVALVVSWFGTDLRAGHCRIVPGVETLDRSRESADWSVSGIARKNAYLVSRQDGGPAYGGTPSDGSVRQAIADLKARGLKVYLYPFVMMDVAADNGLPDPYGAAEQARYPWRGRITCHPAAGRPGTTDRSAAVRAEIAAFCGAAEAGDFDVADGDVAFDGGGDEAGYRRMILHYAQLAASNGGVDGFIIGSELRGLTQLRDDTGAFPFVQALVRLAGDVRGILGPAAKLTYGADWSEYFGYHPVDGSGDVLFNLDPLWASPAIDAVGIDNYMPLSDWRDDDLLDVNPDGARLADDRAAMTAAIVSGEGYDWYYASDADRQNRVRSPITDGMAGQHWLFRNKDIFGWWSHPHHERIGGVEREAATAWLPGMKPVWLTELGCPAIDKGANQPNVFVDPKSAESAVPYFSGRARSDSMQRRFLEAHHDFWQGGLAPAGMLDPDHVFVWTWDARPFPAFPLDTGLWSDGANWRTGHWLNGRLGAATLADVIAAVLTDHGFSSFDVSAVSGDLGGYVQGDVGSARSLLEPLLEIFQVDAIEDGPVLRFFSRALASLPAKNIGVLADSADAPLWSETRGHDSDFAGEVIVNFTNPALDYEQASVRSRRLQQAGGRVLGFDLAGVLAEETAVSLAESLLRDHRIARRTLEFSLSPAEVGVEPGDVLRLEDGPAGRFLVTRIEDGAVRRLEAREFAAAAVAAPVAANLAALAGSAGQASAAFAPVLHLLDLPRYTSGEAADFARVAALAKPWRRIAMSSSAGVDGFATRVVLDRPARVGRLVETLDAGVSGRFDRVNRVTVDLSFGGLSSVPEVQALNGNNLLAVQAVGGGWEVLAFARAEEVAPGRWQLQNLLRGLAGTEDAMAAGAVIGAAVVVLDEAVRPLGLGTGERGLRLNWIAEAIGMASGQGASGQGAGGRDGPLVFEGGLRAETPLSPVHLRGGRRADGAIALSWVRRGRIDADDWQAADIPADEAEERFRVVVLRDGDEARTVEVTSPGWVYSALDELADFGAAQTALTIKVCQMGRVVPLGLWAEAVILV